MLKLPEETGLNKDTIRYYEKIRQLPRFIRWVPKFIGWLIATLLLASPLPDPKVETIQTYPIAADEFGTVLLPNGSDSLHIEAHVKNAESVCFWLTYLELGAEEYRQLLYEDQMVQTDGLLIFPMTRMKVFLIS